MKLHGFFRLVGFECRKAFWNKWMLLFFSLLLLVNGWTLRDAYSRKVARWQDYEAQYNHTYESCQGSITAEKVSALMEIYGPLEEKYRAWTLNYTYDPDAYTYSEGMDEEFYRTLFVTEMRYDYFYQNEAHRISSNAKALGRLYKQLGNAYEAAKNLQIAVDFAGRSIPAFSDTRGYEVLLEYDFSSMLILLLSVFALCRVFVGEKETDMYMLLQTSRRGTAATPAAKLAASAFFVISVSATFFTQDFLTVYLSSCHNEALHSPVYALRMLEATPLQMRIGIFFLYAAVHKLLGILGCAAVILLISKAFRQTLGAFLTALCVITLLALLQEFSAGIWVLKWFNPMELILFRELIRVDAFVPIGAMPIRAVSFVTVGIAFTTGILCVGLLCRRRGR